MAYRFKTGNCYSCNFNKNDFEKEKENELNQKQNELNQKQSQIYNLNSEITKKQNEINSLNSQKTTQQTQLNTNLTEINNLKSQVTSKQQEINSLNSQKTTQQTQLNTNLTEINNLKSQITSKQSEINTLNSQKTTQQTQLNTNLTEINQLKSQITSKQNELTQNQNEINTLKSQNQSQEQQLKQTQSELTIQNNQVKTLQEQNKQLIQQSKQLEEEQKIYQQQAIQFQEISKQHKETTINQNDMIKVLQNQLSKLNNELNSLKDENKQQQQQSNDFQLKLARCEDRNKQIDEDKLKQISITKDLEKELKEKNLTIQQQQDKQNNLEKQQNVLKQEHDIKLQENQKLEQTNQLITKQLTEKTNEHTTQLQNVCDIQKKYDSLNTKYNDLTEIVTHQEKILKEKDVHIQELCEQQKKQEDENKNLNEVTKKLQVNQNEMNEKLEEFKKEKDDLNALKPQKDESQYGYDLIIKMKSIKDLQNNNNNQEDSQRKGLKVQKFNSDLDSCFKQVLVIGMQGLRNKGKTFVLNSLIDENFPSDFHVSTPGICLKHHSINGKNIVYVDSEGLNCPISIDFEKNEHYIKLMDNKLNNSNISSVDSQNESNLQQAIADRHWDLKATEQIQQEFILQSSNILIIVVSHLTLDDQKLIHTLSQKFLNDKKNPKKKHLFVVHNLKDYRRSEHVKEYFEDLKKIFPVRQLPYNQIKKLHDDENNLILCDNINPYINHIVMGYQSSEAGRVYNRFALEYLRHSIGIHQGETHFDVQNKLTEYLNKHLKYFVSLKNNSDEANQTPTQDNILEFDKEKQILSLKKGWQIDKIKELQVNVFGSLERDCSYSLVNVKENKDQRTLVIEIPGSSTYKSKFDKKTGQFSIQINQTNQIENGLGELYVTTRKFEEKHYNIQICDQDENWVFERSKTVDLNNGIVQFVFSKEKEDDYQ